MAIKSKGFLLDPTPGDNTLSGSVADTVQNYIDAEDTTPNLIDTSMTTLGHRIFVLVTIDTSA